MTIKLASGRGILALWADCTISPLLSQTGWQPRREASETVFRLPPPFQSCWFRLPSEQRYSTGPWETQDLPKGSPSGSFRSPAGTRHSLRPSSQSTAPRNASEKGQISCNTVSPLPRSGCCLVYLTALYFSMHIQSLCSSLPYLPHHSASHLPPPCTLHLAS